MAKNKEKITASDIPTLLRKNKKAKLIAVLVIGSVLFLMFFDSTPRIGRRGSYNNQHQQNYSSFDPQETYRGLLTGINAKVDRMSRQINKNTQTIQQLIKDNEEDERRTVEIIKKIIDRIGTLEENQLAQQNAQPVGVEEAQPIEDGLVPIGKEEEAIVPPPPPTPSRTAFIGIGDSVRVKLLAGVNAPTDGTPYPVIFKVIDDITGPDGVALPVGEARLIAAAQGSLVDSRALFRLTALSLRLPNGARTVVDVDGWVVGEDGLLGMQGILIDPLGKAIVAGAISEGIAAAGSGIAAAQTTTTFSNQGLQTAITGDVAKFAAGRAAYGAASFWADAIKDRVNQMVPAVQIFSGREATAVFSQSVEIPDLYDLLQEGEEDIYTPLD
ncbi:MAG: hypothetical protein D6780_05860 [Candidatus Dadabacteria bacterium]|nr:MAG: hypothetical protein D6780_05860 [Candidatus Dadabacteria bacterium]